MTNDTQTTTPASVTQQPATSTAAPTPTPAATSKPKPKTKSKQRRTRIRRRAAASDQESGDEGGGGDGARSDSSVSSRSDAARSESDAEPEEKSVPAPPTGPKPKPKGKGSKSKPPVFADVSSITPVGWSGKDKNGEEATPISFEDSNAGKESPAAPARGIGGGLSIRGRGKGKVDPPSKREYTPEETAKYELQKAKRKEKVKAKKAALKEEKQKGGAVSQAVINGDSKPAETAETSTPVPETAPAAAAPAPQTAIKPPKTKAKKRNESTNAQDSTSTPTVEEITASTSAVTLDAPSTAAGTTDPAPSAQEPLKSPDAAPFANETSNTEAPSSSVQQQRQPPRQPRGNARDPHVQRVSEDPKLTPRAGQFWTHDQRLHEGTNGGEGYANGPRQMGSFWRGRAMPRGAFRGNLRGRGRGGFFPNGRGGFVNGGPPRPVELSQEENKEEGGSKLAMDREYELAEARDKARAAPPAPAPVPASGEDTSAHEEGGEVPAASTPVQPPASSSERKWGHEGYEAMSAPAIRGAFRGRVRGAGPIPRGRGGFFPRGGHLLFAPPHRQMRPAQLAAAARAQGLGPVSAPLVPANATSTTSAAESEFETKPVVNDHEKMSTQPTADSLLDAADESFKIKFPGSAASTVPAAPSPTVSSAPIPAAPSSTNAEELKPAAVDAPATQPVTNPSSVSAPSPALQASEPQFPSLQSGSPAPVAAVQAQMYTGGSNHSIYPMGSENGSAGSGHFVQHPGQFYPPEFVPNGMQMQQRPAFYPQQSQRGYPPQSPGFYPPQSPYSPGPYDQHPHHHAQHVQQRGSFSGAPMTSPQGMFFPQGQVNGYANGRSSPLNPYMNIQPGSAGGGGGFFAPVRGSNKVAIRAPNQNYANGHESNEAGPNANGSVSTANGDSGGNYHAQHYNPQVQPFVPGQHRQDETTYYPLTNGQQYAWQGYGEQGYYDGGVNYGY